MLAPLVDQILEKIPHVTGLYHRLVLVVAPSGGGKTAVLQEVARRVGLPLVSLNLELSRRLLDLTPRQRILQVRDLVEAILEETDGEIVLLDNIEMLFDASLKQDPLRLLQSVSRNRTVVAAWNGALDEGYLTYATPDHPEYRRYPAHDLMLVHPGPQVNEP